MTPDELRNRLMDRIDSLLGRPLAVWGEDRRLLLVLREYVGDMTEDDLCRVLAYYTSSEEEAGATAPTRETEEWHGRVEGVSFATTDGHGGVSLYLPYRDAFSLDVGAGEVTLDGAPVGRAELVARLAAVPCQVRAWVPQHSYAPTTRAEFTSVEEEAE